MKHQIGTAAACGFLGISCATAASSPGAAQRNVVQFSQQHSDYWPTSEWKVSTPEEQGMSSSTLAKAVDLAVEKSLAIHSLLIIRHGRVLLDATFYPFSAGSRHDVASITKSVTSLLTGAAILRGSIPPAETPLSNVLEFRSARPDPRKSQITFANLLSMQSGLDCGFKGSEVELHSMLKTTDWIQSVVDLPMRSQPGTEVGYCSGNYHLLSAALTKGARMSELELAKQSLFSPLGITDVVWPTDPSGLNHGWGDLQLRARDLAKIGFLMLHGGEWDGHRIVSREWITWSTKRGAKYGDNDFYGYGWWSHASSPSGFYEAIGRGGQRLSIWPETDLIVVMLGGGFQPDAIGSVLLDALVADTALPPNLAGETLLASALRRAASPATAKPTHTPVCAKALNGVKYSVASNSMDLRSFTLEFPSADSAFARVEVDKYNLRLPVGLDGIYRTASTTIDGIAPATRGSWVGPCEFVLDLNLIGKIDRYTIDMTFDRGTARVSISEATGLMKEQTSATASTR